LAPTGDYHSGVRGAHPQNIFENPPPIVFEPLQKTIRNAAARDITKAKAHPEVGAKVSWKKD